MAQIIEFPSQELDLDIVEVTRIIFPMSAKVYKLETYRFKKLRREAFRKLQIKLNLIKE